VAANAREKGLNLAYTIDKDVPNTIIGDPVRLRQILVNLLSNAIKFTDKGEVRVSVSSQPAGSIYEIHFAIKDTGIGIPKDKMSPYFSPSARLMPQPHADMVAQVLAWQYAEISGHNGRQNLG
jgi:signal transduction histidine kinase